MRLLAISTSSPAGSVALLDGGQTVQEAQYVALQAHAERLLQTVEQLLGAAGWSLADVEAVACDVGPGSFTGLRVGLAAALGLSFGGTMVRQGVSALDAVDAAARAHGLTGLVAVALDAKRGEVFFAAREALGVPLTAACLSVDEARAVHASLGHPALVGSGAAVLYPDSVTPPQLLHPSAVFVGAMALARPQPFAPLYLRPAHVTTPRLKSVARIQRTADPSEDESR